MRALAIARDRIDDVAHPVANRVVFRARLFLAWNLALDAADFRTRWNLCASQKIVGNNANNLGGSDEINLYDNTQALVRGYFDLAPMGPFELKGVSRRMDVFTVRGAHDTGRLATGMPLSPFAGRYAERHKIAELWAAACEDWLRAQQGARP